MAIVWDSLLTTAAALALHERLRGGRLRAFHLDHGSRGLLLWFRERTLAIRLHPEAGDLLLMDPEEPLEAARNLSATVEGVSAPPDDRVILLHLRKVRGGRERWTVALELMTNQWNAVLCEGEDGGIRRIRHILREREGERPLATGGVYRPPPASDREGRGGGLALERWMELLEPVEPARRRGALLSSVAWTSALNVGALLGAAAREDGTAAREALEEGHRRWRELVRAVPGVEAAETAPEATEEPGDGGDAAAASERSGGAVVLHLDGTLQPYPVALPDVPAEEVGDLLDAFRAAAEGGAGFLSAVPRGWMEALEKRAHRARGRIRGLTRELEEASDPAEVRAVGDLILARYGEVPRGSDRAVLTDFEGREVEVELDPALSPQENAAAYYDRAGRAERARERLPGMIQETRADAEEAEALLERAREGEASAEEIRAAIPDPDGRGSGDAGGDDGGEALPYHRYRSSGGLEIRVGRGSRRNDDLTFHHSRPDDVWLHARHAAGAHVILRWDDDGNPPARDLAEAGVLAALHSKARTSGSVPVDWTRRKYVRKPRKAPPGAVLPDRVQTVFVSPDPAVEERLRED